MLEVIAALVPVLSLIAVGWVLKKIGFPDASFWRPAARIVYFIFLPALLLRLVALAELDPGVWRAQAAAGLAVLGITVLLVLTKRMLALNGPAFTSVLQGSIRHNTYLGLAVGAGVLAVDEVANFALIVAAVVPLVNAIAIVFLARFGKRADGVLAPTPAHTVKLVVGNPLIAACVVGVALNTSGIGLPGGTAEILRLLGQPALPLGLLVVGAGLQLRALRQISRATLVPLLARLIVYPALTLVVAGLLAVPSEHLGALLLLATLPTAASAYVLALELGGDEELMARIITLETLAAGVTIPLWLWYFL